MNPLETRGGKVAPVGGQTHPPKRILVVNDESDTRQFYCEVLTQSGYQVDTAQDGDAGWQTASRDPDSYDLMITDNNMPKMSGVELVRKLRSARMALPVIMATSAVPPNIDGLQIAAILTKPFYPNQLVQTVKDVLHAANSAGE